ncbi:hypothetical protein B0I35DRAFT_433983 [Stachybotrys elegans]|uniref:Uncharacterized protein n=1 Tax=Stachybotrys elegans TaxID=80388 RepID=A0A8K0SMG7_9HYPO|nr:hypothetical protein B0I35DRAFT_433983 [Stachybotrys elegans]
MFEANVVLAMHVGQEETPQHHGGWHVSASYENLVTALRAAGFEVHVPRHPSTNSSRPPNADLSTDSLFMA